MRRKIDIVLDVEKELLFYLIDNPKEIDKLPNMSLLLPKEKIILPVKDKEIIGKFHVKSRLPLNRKL